MPGPAKPVRFHPPRLSPRQSAAEAARRALEACRRHFTGNLPGVLQSDNPEFVHQARVALRRLRVVLSEGKGLWPKRKRKVLSGEAKVMAEALGRARDLDVLREDLLKEGDFLLLARLDAARGSARNRARRVLKKHEGDFVRRLSTLAARPGPAGGEQAVAFAARRLMKKARLVRKRARGLSGRSVEDLHRLRIAAKKLRYTADAFQTLFPSRRVAPYLERLKALQSALGRLQDNAVARRLLARLGGPPSNQVTLNLAARERFARRDLRRGWRAFRHARPFWGNKYTVPEFRVFGGGGSGGGRAIGLRPRRLF